MIQPNECNIIDKDSMTICNECVLNVNNFYAFKHKVINVQTVLNEQNVLQTTPNQYNVGTNTNESIIIHHQHGEYPIELDESGILEVVDLQAIEKDIDETQIDPLETYSEHIYGQRNRDGDFGTNRAPTTAVVVIDNYENIQLISGNEEIIHEIDDLVPAVKRAKKSTGNDLSEKFSLQVNECLICPSVLGDILQLSEHIQNHELIRCKVCMRRFQRYANLKRHFASVHSKPKPFVCDICGLGFSFSVNLQAHAALHYAGKIKVKPKH